MGKGKNIISNITTITGNVLLLKQILILKTLMKSLENMLK
jgi:hypothetical protein